MNRRDFPSNTEPRQFLANMLDLVDRSQTRTFVGRDIRYVFQPVLQGTERIWGMAESTTSLATTYISCGDCMLIVIGGAQDFFNIDRFMQESNVFFSNPDYHGFAPLVEVFAQTAFTAISDWSIPITGDIYLAGYSLGGCVAYKLADMLKTAGFTIPTIWTFGSPRPGGEGAARVIDAFRVRRFYNIDDPVRAVPPHFDEAWSIWPLINQFTRNKWNAQVQPAGGISIDGGGYFVESPDVFPQAGGDTIVSVARYYLGLETLATTAHALQTYRNRILMRPDTTPITPLATLRPREESPAAPTPAETRQVIQQGIAAQQVAAAAPAQPRTIVVGTNQGSVVSAYRARHVGNMWVVMLDGVIVDVGPGKRAAHQKAHRWNLATR